MRHIAAFSHYNRNVPQRRIILANCPNLMMWSDADIFDNFTSAEGNGGMPVNELTLRCAREVYREYQRQLWDPKCAVSNVRNASKTKDRKRNGLSMREQKWVDELLPGDEVEIVRIGSVESIKGPGKSAEHHSHTFLQGRPLIRGSYTPTPLLPLPSSSTLLPSLFFSNVKWHILFLYLNISIHPTAPSCNLRETIRSLWYFLF